MRSRLGKKQNKTFTIFSKLYVVTQTSLKLGFTKEINSFSAAKELNNNNNFSFIMVCAKSSYTSYPIFANLKE